MADDVLLRLEEIDKQREIIEEDEMEPDNTNYEINTYPAFYTLENYSKYFKDHTFNVPDFQRRPVWDDVRKSRLIESFFMGLPVPPVFLFTKDGASFSIVDGLQRISTIAAFLNDEFKLKKLNENSPYCNKKFSELDQVQQRRLQNVVLSATVIRPTNFNDRSILYKIFERLNTGGVSLNNMEIRRSIAYGKFLMVLEETNKNMHWQNILGVQGLGKRFLDLELVLRCFAFYEVEYTGVMKSYLNEYMESNKNSEKTDVQELFLKAVEQIDNVLPEHPFSINKSHIPNYTLLDSVIVALMHNGEVENLPEKFELLKQNPEYMEIILRGNGTTSKKFVDTRLEIARNILK